jgi:hypothetical protein
MADLEALYRVIDHLSREALEELNRYVQRRRMTTVWSVPPEEIRAIEQLMRPVHDATARMSEEEINAVLDDALTEVRRERKTQSCD